MVQNFIGSPDYGYSKDDAKYYNQHPVDEIHRTGFTIFPQIGARGVSIFIWLEETIRDTDPWSLVVVEMSREGQSKCAVC